MIAVYYVTARHVKVEKDGPREERAKFFDREAADTFAAGLNTNHWREVAVEEREETQEGQHHAHGGKVGAPAGK